MIGRQLEPPAIGPDGRPRLLIPLVLATEFLMEQLDQTITTTAIPDTAESLGERRCG